MSRGEGTFSWTTLTLQLLGSCFLYVCESAIFKMLSLKDYAPSINPWELRNTQASYRSLPGRANKVRLHVLSFWKVTGESVFKSSSYVAVDFWDFCFPSLTLFKVPCQECILSHLVSCVFLGIIVWVTYQRFALHLVRWVDFSESSFRR